MASTTFNLENFLPYKLAVLSDLVGSGIARTFEGQFNLSSTQWRVLAAVAARPGITGGQVAEVTPMDKVAVSRAVTALVEKKLLRRGASRDDGRVSLLYLTAKGTATYDVIWPKAQDYDRRLQKSLSMKQRETLGAALKILKENAEVLRQVDWGEHWE